MTDPSLYRDDSRVRHMLDAMQRIVELSKGLDRAQLRKHENVTEMILFNLMGMYSSGNKKILQIAMLFTVSLVAPFVTYGALPVVAPNASTYADTEAVTNVAFNAGDKNDRLFNLTLELDATVSNNVSVAFGRDDNENGLLEREEADAVVGWDSGAWFYQDRRAHVEEQIARDSSHRLLNWQLILSSHRTAKSLVSTDNNGVVFGNAIPPTMFDSEWNLMQVTTRGLFEPNGVVVTQARGWGFNVRVR